MSNSKDLSQLMTEESMTERQQELMTLLNAAAHAYVETRR